jgi:class 3 adenylate cyclase
VARGRAERDALKHVAEVHAAAEPPLPARLAAAGARLRMRVGVHVGDVTYGVICIAGARTDVFGPAAMAAKAAESGAPAGGTLLSPAAARAFAEAQLVPALALRVRVEPVGGGGALVAAMAPEAAGRC